jgi:Ni,Fe-hydrogenase I small subunit
MYSIFNINDLLYNLIIVIADDVFVKGIHTLVAWLEKGDCIKRNSTCFYSMIQSTNSHVRRLLNEKSQYDDELQKAKELMRQRMTGLLLQCENTF